MKIALIQFNATADKQENVRRAARMTQAALQKGAAMVLLPEAFSWRGDTKDPAALAAAAEDIQGPTIRVFRELARKGWAHILAGSIMEKVRRTPKVYNTSVLVSPQGAIAAKYRKIHLFDARIHDKIIREGDVFLPGKEPIVAKAGGFKIGLSICYDLRFPDLYWGYGRRGANALAVPSCFTKKTGQAHWELLLRSRAVENLSYCLAPNQVGRDAKGVEAYGNSMVVSPWGEVIARAGGAREEIIYAVIEPGRIKETRAMLPAVMNR